MSRRKQRKLTPYEARTVAMFVDFDEAAKAHGWAQDQGGRAEAEQCEREYKAAKDALFARIEQLLRTRRNLNRSRK